MVRVRNKKQKTEWEIEDPAMLRRMRADPEHYEVLDDPKPTQGMGQEKGIDTDKLKQPVKSGK